MQAKHDYSDAVYMSESIQFDHFNKGKASIVEISVLNTEDLIALMIDICTYLTYSLILSTFYCWCWYYQPLKLTLWLFGNSNRYTLFTHIPNTDHDWTKFSGYSNWTLLDFLHFKWSQYVNKTTVYHQRTWENPQVTQHGKVAATTQYLI